MMNTVGLMVNPSPNSGAKKWAKGRHDNPSPEGGNINKYIRLTNYH